MKRKTKVSPLFGDMLLRVRRISKFPVQVPRAADQEPVEPQGLERISASRFSRVFGRFAACSLDGVRSRRPACRTGALPILIWGLGVQLDIIWFRSDFGPGCAGSTLPLHVFFSLSNPNCGLARDLAYPQTRCYNCYGFKPASQDNIVSSGNAACNARQKFDQAVNLAALHL